MKKYKMILGPAILILTFAFFASLAFGQAPAKADITKTAAQVASKININKATVEQLMELKGIGESYAKKIVEYREKNGPFKKIEDIQEVKGIGSKLFEAIKDQITI
jgi:competence protein ComEA